MKLLLSFARRLRRPLPLLGLVVCLVGGAAWLLWPTDPVCPRAFDRIQLGMTEEEVKAAMGMPPGNHYTVNPLAVYSLLPLPFAKKGNAAEGVPMFWAGDQYCIMVWCDDTGAVVGAFIFQVPSWKSPSLLDRLRARLGI